MEKKILTVWKLNKYIKNMLEEDFVLRDLLVQGEISNVKYHGSGHIYFTLKDSKACINSVMFKSYASGTKFKIENGMKITCCGYVSIYEATGQFQLYVESVEPMGAGSLTIAFEQLKEKLEQKGYFGINAKKEIPKYPRCVAVITSPTGAAIKDIIQTISRRNNSIKIAVLPTIVQGETAKTSICQSIEAVNSWGKADVIILGRGGGSIEDLWCFNEEKVADAIFKSKIPIISAVGHETDFTIADFVADLRVSTPTAAGEIVSIPKDQIKENINNSVEILNNSLADILKNYKNRLENIMNNKKISKPETIIFKSQLHIEQLIGKLNKEIEISQIKKRTKYEKYIEKLEILSPLNIIKRGYSTIENEKGEIQLNCKNIKINDKIKINMQDGHINAVVVE